MGFDAVFTEFLQVYPVELLGHSNDCNKCKTILRHKQGFYQTKITAFYKAIP